MNDNTQTVTLDSGQSGWRSPLRANYDSYEEFEDYCDNYGLHKRLGFQSAEHAWEINPVIQGGTLPQDYRIFSVTLDGRTWEARYLPETDEFIIVEDDTVAVTSSVGADQITEAPDYETILGYIQD